MTCGMRANSIAVIAPRSGSINTSPGCRCSLDSSVPRLTMMPTIWLVMSNAEVRSWRLASGKLTSTTMSRSTPMPWASSTGTVVDESAIDEQASVHFDGREDARRGHARAQDGHQVTLAEHHSLARLQVGRECPERRGQPVEILDVGDARSGLAQHLRDLAALHQPEWQRDAFARTHAERTLGEDVAVVLLAAVRTLAARCAVANHFLPVEIAENALDFLPAQPSGVQAAHDGTHAGAGDGIDWNPHLLQRANGDSHVGGAASAAAAQHQADARPCAGSAATDASLWVLGAAHAGSTAANAAMAASHAHGLPAPCGIRGRIVSCAHCL